QPWIGAGLLKTSPPAFSTFSAISSTSFLVSASNEIIISAPFDVSATLLCTTFSNSFSSKNIMGIGAFPITKDVIVSVSRAVLNVNPISVKNFLDRFKSFIGRLIQYSFVIFVFFKIDFQLIDYLKLLF